MANKDDYLTDYRCFFENFAQSYNPHDQLPVKLGSYKLASFEVVGGIIDWTTQYLNQKKCPQSLLSPLIKIIIEEVRGLCRKQTLACGFSPSSNAYDPLKLMQCVVTKTNEICLRYLDNSKLCSLPSPGPPYNAVSVCAIKNSRRRMEDRHVIIHDLNTLFIDEEVSPSSYYAIFDGHAGHDAASYSCAHLHQFLGESKYFISNPEQALKDAFLKTDTLFNDKCNLENFRSGTTALCALLKPKEKNLYIAWVGDSQAVLVSQGQCIQCVQPHKPCREDEKLRIEQEGGTVMYWGTWRVNGQLAVSRAIGDVEYKPYVTAVPDIIEIPLTGLEDFLVLACDGLWDVMTEKDAARHVYENIIQNPGDIEGVSQHLVQLAKENGSCDNISVIVVFLREPSKVVEEAHWATRHNIIMDTLDNANATNPFAISNNGDIQNKEDYVMNLGESFKQNASETMEFLSATNGKCSAHEFDEDDDLGPETDVDAIDDVLIGTTVMAAKSLMEEIVMNNSSLCEQEKATLETDNDLIKQHVDYMENNYHMREDTPPADSVDLIGGLNDNVADSGDESEEEWDYIKGDQAEKENIDPSQNDKEICELTSDLDNMSQLNPNAAEFVPISPNRTTASPLYEKIMDDFVIAQSPKRGPNNDHDINVPNLQEFETEIKLRPSEIQECATKEDASDNASALTSQEIMENLLNGKDIDEIEFQPNSTPIKFANAGEFHFGPNSTPFLAAGGFMDQSEVLSTKAVVGEDSTYLEDNLNDSQVSNKGDPMSMSFYQEKDDSDLNKVQVLPENIDDFLQKPKEEEGNLLIDTTSPDVILNSFEKESEPVLNEEKSVCFESSHLEENSLVDVTISDLPEHNPLESVCIQTSSAPDVLESSILTAEIVPAVNTNLEQECARSPILDAQSPDLSKEPIVCELEQHSQSPVELQPRAISPMDVQSSPLPRTQSPDDLPLSPLPPAESPLKSPISPLPQLQSPIDLPLSPLPQVQSPPKSPVDLPPSPLPRIQSPLLKSPSPVPAMESPIPTSPDLDEITSSVKGASPMLASPTEQVACETLISCDLIPEITSAPPVSIPDDVFINQETECIATTNVDLETSVVREEVPVLNEDIEIHCEMIAPEFQVQTVILSPEENRTEEIQEETNNVAALEAKVPHVALTPTAAVPEKKATPKVKTSASTKKPLSKPTTATTKQPAKLPATKPSPATTKASLTKAPAAATKVVSKTTPKDKTPTSAKLLEKKPLSNGDAAKPLPKKVPTTAVRQLPVKSVPPKPTSTRTVTENKTTTRPASAPSAAAPRTVAPKPGAARPPITKTTTVKSTTTTKTVSSPKLPSTGTASKPKPLAPDTKKQIKETTNKQITSRTVPKSSGVGSTLTKTASGKVDVKKPAELIRHSTTKTTSTGMVKKTTKNVTNGVTPKTKNEANLIKDVSPVVENNVIDNS